MPDKDFSSSTLLYVLSQSFTLVLVLYVCVNFPLDSLVCIVCQLWGRNFYLIKSIRKYFRGKGQKI